MGGTLIDTYPAVDRLLCEVVRDHGGEITQFEVACLTRVAISNAINTLADRFGIPVERLEAAYADLKHRWEAEPPPVMAGAEEVSAHVRAVGGRNLVVTHRDRISADALVKATGLAIDDMICAPDGYPRKPDPQMYHLILDRNKVDAKTCLAVGDRAIDDEAAAAAGMAAILLETPGMPVVEGNWLRITSLTALIPLLG